MKEKTTEPVRKDVKMVTEKTSDCVGNGGFCRVSQGKEWESLKE